MPQALDSSPSSSSGPRRFRLVTLGQLALHRPDGSLEPSLGVGGRKLAFLAYVALAERPLTRDHLAEVFWGDRDDDRARHSLREATSHIRRVLGSGSIPTGQPTISLSGDAELDIDFVQIVAAAKLGDWTAVLAAANGTFLDGVHVADSRRFDEWIARERSNADRIMLSACRAESERLEQRADLHAWTDAARRWLALSPLQADAALSLLRARSAPGTRDAIAHALDDYRRLTERLARDYDAVPSAEVARFAATLSDRLSAAPVVVATPPIDVTPSRPGSEAPVGVTHFPPQSRWRRRSSLVAAATLLLGVGLVGWGMSANRTNPANRPLLAVTSIRSLTADTADAWLGAGVSQMLTMALSRAGTDVIAPDRVRESTSLERLGATLRVSGGISHGAGQYVLDLSLRAVSAKSSAPHVEFAVSGPDLVSVVDQATARLAAALDAPADGPKLEAVETRSVAAYRSFVRGLERRSEGRYDEAVAAFDEAIAADSGFVSAVLERLLTSNANTAADGRLRVRARQLRDRAPEFDRLSLDALDAFYAGDSLRSEATARQLVARYPRDPRGYYYLGTILGMHGRFAETESVLRQRLSMDSLVSQSSAGACALCTGYAGLAVLHLMSGDVPDAVSAAERAVTLQPQHPQAWTALAVSLAAAGRFGDAIRAQSRASQLAPNDPSYASALVRREIEARDYAAAESTIRRWRSGTDPELVRGTADLEATLLRERGRYRDAAALLDSLLQREPTNGAMALVLGHSLAASGMGKEAERVFERQGGGHTILVSEPTGGFSNFHGEAARAFAWPHALLADALYLAGSPDTVHLRALADSVQSVGTRSYYARDWRLFHHIRGLIALRGQRWHEAEVELRAAEYTQSGWTRTNVELARAQLQEGNARDAIETLRAAYQASLDGMGRYATRSEIDFLMAQAMSAAGRPDSAAVYAGYVRRAWRDADPSVRRRLRELPGG
jgi:DNA-binding SARP family transcriptional activator/TolB-like protein